MALAVALAAPAASAAAPATNTISASCPKTGKIARIDGKRMCLATGRSCSRVHQKQYKRNGYSCARDSKGRYRLKKVKQEF